VGTHANKEKIWAKKEQDSQGEKKQEEVNNFGP
jgi:hypothetical protein